MNISTGLFRLAQAIKWGGRTFGGIFLVVIVIDLLTSTPQRQSDSSSNLLIVLGLIVGFMAVTEVIAWVIEGFSDD